MLRYSFMNSFFSKRAGRWIPSNMVEEVISKDWDEFLVEIIKFQPIKWPEKHHAPLISPAFYDGEKKRKNENVGGWSFLALDFDGATRIDEVEVMVDGLKYLLYTTASCTEEHHKFRLFVPFTRNVMPDEIPLVWDGAYNLFGARTDAQCKDMSRGYYVPGTFPGAHIYSSSSSQGQAFDPDILASHASPHLSQPSEPATTLFRPHVNQISWVGLDDCPMVRRSWVDEYLNLPSGLDQHYATLYRFMVRVAGKAHNDGQKISEHQLAGLAAELDRRKDGRWAAAGRSWTAEARNAIKYVGGC